MSTITRPIPPQLKGIFSTPAGEVGPAMGTSFRAAKQWDDISNGQTLTLVKLAPLTIVPGKMNVTYLSFLTLKLNSSDTYTNLRLDFNQFPFRLNEGASSYSPSDTATQISIYSGMCRIAWDDLVKVATMTNFITGKKRVQRPGAGSINYSVKVRSAFVISSGAWDIRISLTPVSSSEIFSLSYSEITLVGTGVNPIRVVNPSPFDINNAFLELVN